MSQNVLYRFIDRRERLLYVGITMNPPKRFRDHGRDRWWWEQIAKITLEHRANRVDLLMAERRAIERERPIYNVQHNWGSPTDQAFDVIECPACGAEAFYRSDLDRYYHLWGQDNIVCWVSLSRGENQ